MSKQIIKDLMERVAAWPEADQQALAEYAREIEAWQNGTYGPTEAELRGTDKGLEAARRGEFATDEEVRAVFAKYRRT